MVTANANVVLGTGAERLDLPIARFTNEQYLTTIDAGVWEIPLPADRVELIHGFIIPMDIRAPIHNAASMQLVRVFAP